MNHVPLTVDAFGSASVQPVSVGIPFPKGVLNDVGSVRLIDPRGNPAAHQSEALARWTGGSVKWLLLDFLISSPGVQPWQVVIDAGGRPEDHAGPIAVEENAEGVVIRDRDRAFRVGRDPRPHLLTVTAGGWSGLRFNDARGRARPLVVDRLAVEAWGPVRATVRVDGRFGGRRSCRLTVRYCAFAGTGLVRARVTLHNPRRARHPGGLWDLGDPGSVLFRELALTAGRDGPGPSGVVWRAERDQPFRDAGAGGVEIDQNSSGGENWRSRNHVNRLGRVPCAFRGYRVRTAEGEASGLRASPVVALRGGPAVAVAEFWQQFPKVIAADGSAVTAGLFPGQFGDLHELQGGERKTHTVWLDFGGEGPGLDWVERPAAVSATADWYAATGAVPDLSPASADPGNPLDALLAEAGGPDGIAARREAIDEYGWRHFGEVHADHEAEHYHGPPPVVSHYNNQYDMVNGFLLQALRTGDPRWAGLFGPLARHVADVDIYHTREDRAAYNGGLFWFTDHYLDAATSTHRTYSRANRRPGDRSYGGGPSSAHNFATGLLHAYDLTGDPLLRDAVVELADWVIGMDDGRKTPLGLVDRGPTGLASFTHDPGYHGPGRGCGNSVAVLLDAWAAVADRRYLDKAEALIRRSVHPADDVAARDLLNVELRWSYTVFLAALARYLDVKAEAGELDFMYAYARASLVRYALWMSENEAPYFDHPGRLEYPTEAWAGQELRKANVLRLAARHADAPSRPALVRRADELAGRAWDDLRRFPTRTSARALALAMVEGARDVALRGRPVIPAPEPAAGHDFGRPRAFTPQKHRVAAPLRAARRLARSLTAAHSNRGFLS